MRKKVPILILVVLVSGCAAMPGYFGPNEVTPILMQPRLQYRGFSVAKPPNNNWNLRVSEQQPIECIFRRTGSSSKKHSAFISIRLEREKTPSHLTVMKDFINIIANDFISSERIEITKTNIRPSEDRDGVCVDFDIRAEDKTMLDQQGNRYRQSYIGFSCIHPAFSGMAVTAMYSERSAPADFSNQLPPDVKIILDSVQLESSPGVPVTLEPRQ